MSVEGASLMMLVAGFSFFFFIIVGGVLGQWLYNKNPKNVSILFAVVYVVAVIPFLFLLSAEAGSLTVNGIPNFKCMFIASFCGLSGIASPNIRGMLLNVNDSRTRGTVFSGLTLMEDVGKGLGPTFVVALISYFGRQTAFITAFLFWFFCAMVLLSTAFTLPKDLATLREKQDDLEDI